METNVQLQDPFSYSIWPMVIVGSLIVAIILYFIISHLLRKRKLKKDRAENIEKKIVKKDVGELKVIYIDRLNEIESKLDAGEITTREAYQKMSPCIREFIYEATGIEVRNYTLSDARKVNMPVLKQLMEEYYIPEFGPDMVKEAKSAIEKTKKAIEIWN